MNIPLDEVIHFDFITSTPATGAATDADSTPTFAVYEEDTDTDIGIGGNMTKRTSLTGNYRGTFTLSAANGFELGKWYAIIGSAVVGGITGKAVLKNFRVVAAELVAGYPVADTVKLAGQVVTAAAGVTFPTSVASPTNITAGTITTVTTVTNQLTAAQIATGVWQDTTAGDFTTASSIGKSLYTSGAVPGAAGGLFIAGTNAATTVNITGTITTVTTVTNQLTAAQIATGVWQDTTAGDFTVASSIGKSLYTSGVVPGAAGGLFIAGTNAATTVTTSFTTTFTGDLTGTVAGMTAAGWATAFTVNSTKAYADAVSGSLVKGIADHVTLADGVAHGGTPGSSTATIATKQLNITNSNGHALVLSASGAGNAIDIYCDEFAGINIVSALNGIQILADDGHDISLQGSGDIWDVVNDQLISIMVGEFANDAITAASIADGAIDAATFASGALDAVWSTAARTITGGTVTTVTNQLTAAQIATGVWQDSTAGDFTVASSIGKSLYTSGVVPGAAGGHFIAGTNAATTVTTSFTTTFTGNVTGTVAGMTAAGWAGAFTVDTTKVYADAIAGSVVFEIVDNAGGGSGLDAAGVRAAVGLATANLDTQLSGIAGYIDTEIGTIVTQTGAAAIRTAVGLASANLDTQLSTIDDFLDTEIAAIKAKTDLIPAAPASTTNITAGTITTVTNLTNLPSIPANWLTAAGTATDFGAEVAGAVWDEATAGHAGAGSTGLALSSAGSAGDPWSTALPGAYASGTAGKIVGDNVDAAVSSRMATYTQPTGFLAATFPDGIIASTTNIIAGTIDIVRRVLRRRT